MKVTFLRALVILFGFISCGEAPVVKPTKAIVSTETICEHEIQQAICARCNPALAAVYQAKGDWCQEHGFAESTCPICHPEKKRTLIVADSNPKKEEPAPPSDGTRVKLKSSETARLAGISTAKASEHPSNALLSTTATIVYDATRYAQVNARASGVVRELKVDIGTDVASKTTLAVIQSASVGADRSRVKGAAASLNTAKENYRRIQELVDKGLAARKELLDAQVVLDAAQTEYNSSTAALGEIDKGASISGGYSLTAPISGIVVRRNASLGALVDTEDVLFEIADTSSMWVSLDIPETDISLVSLGQEVAVQIDALPNQQFKGTIRYLAPEVDPRTRTITARASLENPDGLLRANMFATALILGEQRSAVMVPREAIQKTRGVTLVFVKVEPDVYVARYVSLLPDNGEGPLVGVSKGLSPGEEVVTEGSFLLKTETLKESIGAGCCADE